MEQYLFDTEFMRQWLNLPQKVRDSILDKRERAKKYIDDTSDGNIFKHGVRCYLQALYQCDLISMGMKRNLMNMIFDNMQELEDNKGW